MKLALGTAAFGQDYGINNDGQPSPLHIERILQLARQAGIDTVDTAPAYHCQVDFDGFKVVQKTPYQGKCYALLQHDPDAAPVFHDGIKCGISVYTPAQLKRALMFPVEIVQFPLNIADGRFLRFLPELRQRGIEIHVRSVFLQGALLSGAFGLPQLTVQECLGYVLAQDVDRVVVGVNSVAQLRGLLEVEPREARSLGITDERIIDPRKWRR